MAVANARSADQRGSARDEAASRASCPSTRGDRPHIAQPVQAPRRESKIRHGCREEHRGFAKPHITQQRPPDRLRSRPDYPCRPHDALGGCRSSNPTRGHQRDQEQHVERAEKYASLNGVRPKRPESGDGYPGNAADSTPIRCDAQQAHRQQDDRDSLSVSRRLGTRPTLDRCGIGCPGITTVRAHLMVAAWQRDMALRARTAFGVVDSAAIHGAPLGY